MYIELYYIICKSIVQCNVYYMQYCITGVIQNLAADLG